MYVWPQHYSLTVSGEQHALAQAKWEARTIAAKLDSAALESYTELKIRIVPNKIAPTQLGVWRGSMAGRVS
jgi:hypothetical protein